MSEPEEHVDEITESKAAPLRPAVEYIRMSTEHQQYSTENQMDVIREYASNRGYRIVRTYEDSGKSGLVLGGRDSLEKLLADVEAGDADFDTILVYDVSRWGRFQDADESAFHEYMCKKKGFQVEYCAEPFENDGSPMSTIIKSVKRAMAGEYSRELSSKVFKGQCRLIELGYRQGGPAGYGLRRMLIDQNGQHKDILKPGEQKSLQTDRVILVPGPDEEVRSVRRIYEMFTREGKKEAEIADWLNGQNIVYTELNRPWSKTMVHQILTNEKYIGNNVYNRRSFKLKKKRVQNPPDRWIRSDGAFEPIVPLDLFYTARGIILERTRRFTNEEMIEKLKQLYTAHGMLSGAIIDDADDMPSSSAFQSRFGSLLKAYRLVGYVPEHDYRYLDINRHLHELRRSFVDDIVEKLEQTGAQVIHDEKSDMLLINGEYTASIVLTRCRQTQGCSPRWLIGFDEELAPDITVIVRMDLDNREPFDFYVLPRIDFSAPKARLGESNGVGIDTYRYESLGYFVSLAARVTIEVAA